MKESCSIVENIVLTRKVTQRMSSIAQTTLRVIITPQNLEL